MPPGRIYHFILSHTQKLGLPISFTFKDVINYVNKKNPKTNLAFDMTDLIKTLNERGLHNNLRLSVAEDASQVTDCVFFAVEKAIQRWEATDVLSRVVFYDTKHGTNRYGLYLGALIHVGKNTW